ncbi:Auxin response factor 3 [Vitis vinifera]|uniref:Auxin response factor 3 n=1 Tax=Vitis vinifera TaxID=29760 RepID=A0A438IGM3_VITVI|nr:Auxin response factor 3 [Vitis vinifera]
MTRLDEMWVSGENQRRMVQNIDFWVMQLESFCCIFPLLLSPCRPVQHIMFLTKIRKGEKFALGMILIWGCNKFFNYELDVPSFMVTSGNWASSSEFIIPLRKFSKSIDHSFSAGMRFKMRVETEDAAERRYTGLITGISDMDPVRWPGSKWRSSEVVFGVEFLFAKKGKEVDLRFLLLVKGYVHLPMLYEGNLVDDMHWIVRWDDIEANRHNRVSPWEIELSGSLSGSGSLTVPGSKRTRIGLPGTRPDFSVPSRWDGSVRLWGIFKVPEGLASCSGIAAIGNGVRNPLGNSDISYKGIGFGESFRFHKVLQGQETFPSPPCGRALSANQAHENGSFGIFDGVQVPTSRNGWPALVQGYNAHTHLSTPSVQEKEQEISNRSSFDIPEVYGEKLTPSRCELSVRGGGQGGMNFFGLLNEHNQLAVPHPLVTQSAFRGSQDLVPTCKSSCRLFGFSLTEERSIGNKVDNPTPVTSSLIPGTSFLPQQLHSEPPVMTKAIGSNCTKLGSVVDQAINRWKLDRHDDLICALKHLFDMEGGLLHGEGKLFTRIMRML